MRLWPTTPLLSRETLVDLAWKRRRRPAGSQILIFNTFHHRDARASTTPTARARGLDRGRRGADWAFNHFSHGPQGCPGSNLALLVGSAVLAELLGRGGAPGRADVEAGTAAAAYARLLQGAPRAGGQRG